MTLLVDFQSVSKKFEDKLLLDQISFKVEQGTINTLIGQNGAGKTTIAKMILGLEKPNSGKIKLKDGIAIGYVPQKLDFKFNMPLTSEGLIKMLSKNARDEEIFKLTEFLDYDNIRHKDISTISPGQLQKLLLAGTLISKPDLLILDEPTQYLDLNSQQQFYHVITKVKEKFDLTIFMISHDLFTVMKDSDQVICINGHVCCSGKPKDLENISISKNIFSELAIYIHQHDHNH